MSRKPIDATFLEFHMKVLRLFYNQRFSTIVRRLRTEEAFRERFVDILTEHLSKQDDDDSKKS